MIMIMIIITIIIIIIVMSITISIIGRLLCSTLYRSGAAHISVLVRSRTAAAAAAAAAVVDPRPADARSEAEVGACIVNSYKEEWMSMSLFLSMSVSLCLYGRRRTGRLALRRQAIARSLARSIAPMSTPAPTL